MDDFRRKTAPENGKRVDIADPFARRLLAHYLGRREADLESFRAALASRDFDSIRVGGHNLYGSGGAYGLDRISELGGSLESAAADEDHDGVLNLIDLLETYIRDLKIA